MSVRPNWPANSPTEVNKLQQHLALLKKEYVKLQNHCTDLEKKVSINNARDRSEDNFVSRLLNTVAGLYGQKQYSDVSILLANAEEIPGHRFILKSRSSQWGVPDLDATLMLDWSDASTEVMTSLLRWVYTDQVELTSAGDDFCLDLMRASAKFHLTELTNKCEQQLLLSVGVHNCVRLYTTADEIGAETLREHCSGLISVHWDDFTSEDFAHMTAPLLFSMLRAKTSHPLHSAIRLAREDVVFLYLVEYSKELSQRLNESDNKGDIPLLLALQSRQSSLATTLVEHGSSVDARDPRGHTLLLSAIEREDAYSCLFLLEHKACASATTSELGDTGLHILANQHAVSKLQDEESTNQNKSEEEIQSEDMMQVAQKLLDCGLNPNLQNNKGYTALHLSVMNGHESLFSLLLKWPGLALDSPTLEGHTALRFALSRDARNNTLLERGFAARLLEKKANPNPMYPGTGDTLLHLLAREDNETAAIFLCSKGADVLRTNKRGESALHVACSEGLSELVTILLTSGAQPNLQTLPGGDIPDVYKQTPLHLAVQQRQNEVINAILAFKANVQDTSKTPDLNLKNSEGQTPLSLALVIGLKHKVPQLISAGADVNVINSEGLTLLHQALKSGDSESGLFLLEQGANMDCVTPDGHTPLQLAISHSLPSVVEGLCRRGVDMSVLDSKGHCPLWAALEAGEEDIASILVRNGVDTDCWGPGPDDCLQTLLHKALDENQASIACFLIQSGCELNATRRPGPNGEGGDEARDGQTPLHMACTWGLEQVVQTLVEHGAAVNVRDAEGRTPLHVAVANQHARITSLLLCHPALDLSLRDKSGLTPFAAALTSRNNKAAQAILDRLPTAAEQYDNKGYNFLHTAVQRGDLESVLFLLSIGVDANSRVRDSTMCTPLHLACATITPSSAGTTEDSALVVRNLLLAGARPDERDATRRTPLHAAALSGHSAAASALLQNGADPDSTDADHNNPLHLATKASHLQVVRVLLTESTMDAEAKNLRGQTPLHLLASYGRDQVAASICELFRECMPAYPLDQPDLEGNTALLLAYTKGNVNLCKALVKAGCCLGSMNKDGVTIFNYQVPTKQLLHKLLDMLNKEPPWAEGDMCLECGSKFGLTMRKHHCRHCGRLLCSKCSSCDVPILKFGLNKPVRVCNVCFQVLQIGSAS